jgi:hypothetical protein
VALFAELYAARPEEPLVVLLVEQDEAFFAVQIDVQDEVFSEVLPVEPFVVLFAELFVVRLEALCEVLPVEPYAVRLEAPDAVQPVVLGEVLPEVPYAGLSVELLGEPYAGLFAGLSVELLEEPCVVLGTVLDPMQILQMLKTVSKPLTDQSFSFLSPNNICLSFILTNLKQIVKVFLDLFFSFKMTSSGR